MSDRTFRTTGSLSVADELDGDWAYSKRVSGLLAVRLGHSLRHFCAWFRPEHRETVEWGGDPRQPAREDPEGGLSPRDSFEAWTQIVSGRARRWTDLDRATAREMAKLLNELFIEVQSHRLRQINQQLTERNDALEQAKHNLERANARREELLEGMKELARTDELTGLANRRELMRRLEEEVGRARRYGNPLAFAILDLDRFKAVNDRYGHQVGDRVLRRIGELLETNRRAHPTWRDATAARSSDSSFPNPRARMPSPWASAFWRACAIWSSRRTAGSSASPPASGSPVSRTPRSRPTG